MYNKLFTKILDSSIWLESTPTRIVWLTFIACMDESGFVQFAAVGNVANRARVSLDEAQEAIRSLESPDPESFDPDNEGRRIERVPGGWVVLNAEKHRKLVTRAVIQEQTRLRVQRHRDKKRSSNAAVTPSEAEAEVQEEEKSVRARSSGSISNERNVTETQQSVTDTVTEHTTRVTDTPTRVTAYQTAPIIGRNPHLGHVFCDKTFSYCVPQAVHQKLSFRLAPKHHGDTDQANEALRTWYPTVVDTLPEDFVMGDAFKFWQSHFDAAFASDGPKPSQRVSEDLDTMTAGVRKLLQAEGILS